MPNGAFMEVNTPRHEVVRLLSEKTGECVAWSCHECQRVVATNASHTTFEEAEEYALNHDRPPPCEKCGEPRRIGLGYISACHRCLSEKNRLQAEQSERERFEKAEKVPMSEWRGECLSDGDDNYFFEIEDALDHYDRNDVPRPEYLWECDPDDMTMSAAGALETSLQDHHEDAESNIPLEEITRLQKYMDRWCKKQGVRSWYCNHKRAILLEKR